MNIERAKKSNQDEKGLKFHQMKTKIFRLTTSCVPLVPGSFEEASKNSLIPCWDKMEEELYKKNKH